MSDWTGNANSIYATHGASNHSESERAYNDYYATPPRATELLLNVFDFDRECCIWEPAAGEGHISSVLKSYGYEVFSSDIELRSYPLDWVGDFFTIEKSFLEGNIITNPPYSKALPFLKKALELIDDGRYVAMLLKTTFLEGAERGKFFETNPPKYVYVFSRRIDCGKNGDFSNSSLAVCYSWFIWEKGFKGDPVIKWLNK